MMRGDIRLLRSRPGESARRVLVLTRDSSLAYMPCITIAPVSDQVRDVPSEVPLSRLDGMPGGCAVNCDRIQTVSVDRVGERVTHLGAEKMRAVESALAFALGVRTGSPK